MLFRSIKRFKRLGAQYKEAIYFAIHPEFLICHLLLRCMGVLLYTVYLVFLVKIDVSPRPGDEFHALFRIHSISQLPRDVVEGVLLFLFSVATLVVMKKGASSFALVRRVQSLKHYVEEVPPEIRDKELEARVLLIADRRWFAPLSQHDIEEFDNRNCRQKAEEATRAEETSGPEV